MIFQKSILNSFAQKQDEVLVASRWANYLKFKEKIDFVKIVKEEKYQEGFLRDIFEKCLGYTLDTTDPNNFNLKREEKNETDSKKADGVIVIDKKIVGVIELKDQKSKHLDTVLNQAFDYHNSHSYSRYIIISNFNELRLYIDKKTEYEKFFLFDLNYKEFEKEKIFYNEIGEGIDFCYDDKKFYCNNKLYFTTSSNLNLKFATAIFNSKLYDFYFRLLFNFGGGKGKDSFKNIPLPNIPKSIEKYQENVEYFLNMPRKKRYDNEKKIAISYLKGKEIYITEFLFAKQRGYIFGLQGHDDIFVEYYKLLPYIFSNFLFDEVFQNIDNKRLIYSLFDQNGRRIFHVIDNKNKLISVYIVSKDKYKRQIDRKFKKVDRWEGGHFSILSPAEPFWRHLSTLLKLYQNFQKNSITQDDFIEKVDKILSAKEKIKLYEKHFDSLNTVEKIEIKEQIEELEKSINENILKIDELVYKLYQLNKEEIQIIKGK